MDRYLQILPEALPSFLMASAMIDFPIIWKNIKDKRLVRAFTLKLASMLVIDIVAVTFDHLFHISELLIQSFHRHF